MEIMVRDLSSREDIDKIRNTKVEYIQSDTETVILCPICEEPEDVCEEIYHWQCGRCAYLLEANEDGYWECPQCFDPII